MRISNHRMKEQTQGFCDIINITSKVQNQVERDGVREGLASIFVSGSTAALTTMEYEPGLIQDVKEFLEKIVPSNRRYHHDDRWGDDNGFSHLRASLLGPSVQVPIGSGKLLLGTWQQIVLLDFDNRPRQREILLQLMGETK